MKNTNETAHADHYFRGDACTFTGHTQVIAGGLFYVYTLIEGHRKGEKAYSMEAPHTAPMLGQDAAEAQRIAVAGRPIRLLKESREFDSSRLEATGLFPPAQRGMFGETK